MVLVRLGALRFHGLIADFGSLPIDATLTGGIFDATDTIQKFVFDGTAWVEFVSGTGEANTGANVGAGTGQVFRDKIGVVLNFKSLIGGTNVTITDNSDDITIDATSGSPLNLKGDLFGFTTVDAKVAVGVDDQVLQADSSQATGLKYVDLLTQKGNLLTFSTFRTELPVGTDGQILTVDSLEATGIKWADPSSATAAGIATIQAPDGTLGKLVMTNDGRLEIEPTNLPAGINPIPTVDTLLFKNTTAPTDPDIGDGILWVETVDADNSGLFAKIKVAGTIKIVRII